MNDWRLFSASFRYLMSLCHQLCWRLVIWHIIWIEHITYSCTVQI